MNESGEMYLETIFILLQRKEEGLHAIDIVNHTGYSKPSISRAMGILKRDGMIDIDDHDHITLTEKCKKIACRIYERHSIITRFLCSIGVDDETADADACKIEHIISDASVEKIKEFLSK